MIERLRNRAKLEHGKLEDVAFRRVSNVMPHEEVILLIAEHFGITEDQLVRRQRGTYYRPMLAKMLLRYCGMTQREIAENLGLTTGTAVSAQIAKTNEMEQTNRKFCRDLKKIETLLNLKKERRES